MKPDSIKTGWAGRDDRTRTDMEKFRGILSPLCLPISPHPDGSACEVRTHAYRLEGPACLPLHQDAIVNERNSASPFYTPPHQGPPIRRALSRFIPTPSKILVEHLGNAPRSCTVRFGFKCSRNFSMPHMSQKAQV